MRGFDYMSASSKKKLRNEQQTAKMTEKQVAEQKEAKKLTLYTTIFVVVLAVMVVFAIAIGVTRSISNSGVRERNTVALTVGDHEISNAELSYFYMSAINNFNTNYGNYAAMMGLDTSKPLDEQVINNDTGLTWADDFLNTAKDNARSVYAMADAAEAAGFTLSEDELAEIDTSISNMKMYATLYGYSSTKDFLKAQYGSGATEESYKQYVTVNTLANAYYNSYSSSLTYTDADLRAAESENYDKYSSFTYNTYYLAASKFQAEDEEDSDKAVKAAEEAANSLIGEDVATVADFDAAIAALDINKDTEASSTAYTDQQYASVSTTVRDWITDSARKEGDKTVIANTTTSTDDDGNETKTTLGYYAVFFTGSNDNTFPLVNVRHILVKFEGGTTDSTTGTTTYSDEEKNAAKEKAEEILDEWMSGDATEDSFAALAEEKSEDPGSSTNGGLYENVAKGQMVEPFEDWCFDETRAAGDYGLVKTKYGYHIMYYVSSTPIWETYAKSGWVNEKTNDFIKKLAEDHPMEVDYSAIQLGYVNLGA